jgi:hypothetical protein
MKKSNLNANLKGNLKRSLKRSNLNFLILNIRKGNEIPGNYLSPLGRMEKDIIRNEFDKTFKQLTKERKIVSFYIEERTLSWSEGAYVCDEIDRKIEALDRMEFFLNRD